MEREHRPTKLRLACGHPRDYHCCCRFTDKDEGYGEHKILDVTEFLDRRQYPYTPEPDAAE